MVEILSLVTALMYALSNIAVRKGLSFGSNAVTASTVSLVTTFIPFTVLLFALFPLSVWNWQSVFIFLAAGILAPGLFRFFLYEAISRIGVTVATNASHIYPLIAAGTSIAFLNERLTVLKAVGMALTLAAVFLSSPRTAGKGAFNFRSLKDKSFLLALAAAVCRGGSETLRKTGLLIFDAPLFGAAIGNVGGFVVSLVLVASSGAVRQAMVYQRTSFIWFILGGFFAIAAWIVGFYALSYGEVLRVTPVIATVPLFTVLLSPILLRGVERITWQVVLASLLVVLGVVCMNLGAS
ncbi:MAG: EamA family transporter [Candidatus Binatia bacterium]